MTNKEELIYSIIFNYYKSNGYMPSIREIQSLTNYKSTNSIYQYLKNLEYKGYLTRNNKKKKRTLINNNYNNLVNIKVINTKENICLNLNIKKQYTCFKLNNDYFIDIFIKKQDYLVIEKTNKLNDNDLGLFIINKKYRIMRYFYKDGFYLLKDKDQEVLHKVHIIGKVIGLYRKY